MKYGLGIDMIEVSVFGCGENGKCCNEEVPIKVKVNVISFFYNPEYRSKS